MKTEINYDAERNIMFGK